MDSLLFILPRLVLVNEFEEKVTPLLFALVKIHSMVIIFGVREILEC